MGKLLARLAENAYVIWSNTVDAPISHVMTRDETLRAVQVAEGLRLAEAKRLVEQADATGTSDPDVGLETLLASNRAGTDESRLSAAKILESYRRAAADPPSAGSSA
jgi:hypothetical protein